MFGNLPQQLCALHLRNVQTFTFHAFNVVRRNSGGIDHKARAVNVFCVMADHDRNALADELVGGMALAAVVAAHLIAQRRQKFRQAGHGASADADEVNEFVLIIR